MMRASVIDRLALSIVAVTLLLPASAGAQDTKAIAHGQEVYNAQKCSMCHSIAGKGNKLSPLDKVGAKLSADDIRKWITDPAGMATGAKPKVPPMPKKWAALPAADLDALVAFMQSLK